MTKYRPDIDGLRAVAVAAVVLFHAFPERLPAGFVGVDIFFVISGYLIGGLIVDELVTGRFSFRSFYARRIRRIFPSLIVVLFCVYLIGWLVLFPDELRLLGRHIAAAVLFVSNYVLLADAGYFDTSSSAKLLLHLWSLAIEEQFYLLWPLVCFWAWRKRVNLLALTLASLALSFAINVLSPDSATAFYSSPSRIWELNAGTAVALLQRNSSIPAALFGVLLIVAALVLPDVETYPGWWALLPVAGSALVIATGPDTWLHRRILAWPPLVFVGLISYPLYLWHWPLLSFANIIYGDAPPPLARLLLVAASCALAYATFVFIERPVRRAPHMAFRTPALLGLVMLAGAVGLVTLHSNGFGDRAVATLNRSLEADLRIPTESRTSDGSCERLLGIGKHDDEVCLATSAQPRFLFVGDSYAMAMFSAIYEKTIDVPAVLIATHSDLWAKPDCLACRQAISDAVDLIGRLESLQAVVIVPFDRNLFFADRAKLGALQSDALKHGKEVIHVLAAPSFAPPASCFPRTLDLFGHRLKVAARADACRAARASLEEESRSQRRLIESLASVDPRVRLYDPLPVFCATDDCSQSDDRGVFFWSSGHVNPRGSARMLRDFQRWMRRDSPPMARPLQ